jgi:type III secretion protein J
MIFRAVFLTLCAFFLAACEEQVLYSELSEHEANEIVSVLYAAKLPASKVATKNGAFRVDTDQASFSQAVALLQTHGLPRERFDSLGEVFAKDGFVSSPLEERARLNYALSQEISRTIASIDGVIMARVHLAVPKKEHLVDEVQAASASVFVKHRADVDLSDSVGKIKSMVVTGFENLPYENVTVGLFAAQANPMLVGSRKLAVVAAAATPQASNQNLLFLGAGSILLLVGLALAVWLIAGIRKVRATRR